MKIKKTYLPLICTARKFSIVLLLFIVSMAFDLTGQVTANPKASAVPNVESLRDALAGKPMTHGGILYEGPTAATFAQGYVAAIADAAHVSGQWCGMHRIKQHELQSLIYERLTTAKPSMPAGSAVNAVLKSVHPCSRK